MVKLLECAGLALFLLGLATGMVLPRLTNPRMGLASHLQGMTNGPFLVVAGLTWPAARLSGVWAAATAGLLVYGTYANWLATVLGAVWGAGHRFAPVAGGDHRSSPGRERTVDTLLASLAPAMLLGTVVLLVGVAR